MNKANLLIFGGAVLAFSRKSGSKNQPHRYRAAWERGETARGYGYYTVTFTDTDCQTPWYPLRVWANQMTIEEVQWGSEQNGSGVIVLRNRPFTDICRKVWLDCEYRVYASSVAVVKGERRNIPRDLIYDFRTRQSYPIYYSGLYQGQILINQWLATYLEKL